MPFIVHNPVLFAGRQTLDAPTSHADLLPTMLGLADLDPSQLQHELAKSHTEVHPLVGRDLSGVILGETSPSRVKGPVYFMTEDEVSRGFYQTSALGFEYRPVMQPNTVETVITYLATGAHGSREKWKYSRYSDNPQFWSAPNSPPQDVTTQVYGNMNLAGDKQRPLQSRRSRSPTRPKPTTCPRTRSSWSTWSTAQTPPSRPRSANWKRCCISSAKPSCSSRAAARCRGSQTAEACGPSRTNFRARSALSGALVSIVVVITDPCPQSPRRDDLLRPDQLAAPPSLSQGCRSPPVSPPPLSAALAGAWLPCQFGCVRGDAGVTSTVAGGADPPSGRSSIRRAARRLVRPCVRARRGSARRAWRRCCAGAPQSSWR